MVVTTVATMLSLSALTLLVEEQWAKWFPFCTFSGREWWCGEGTGNSSEENASIFCLILVH